MRTIVSSLASIVLTATFGIACEASGIDPGVTPASIGGNNSSQPPPPTLADGGATPAHSVDAATLDGPLPPPATNLAVAPDFASTYSVFDLGPLPKLGASTVVGATSFVVMNDAPDTLLISTYAGGMPVPDEGLYRVKVKRDHGGAGHIYAIASTADEAVPSVSAGSIVYGPGGALFATANLSGGGAQPFMQFAPGLGSYVSGTLPIVQTVTTFAFVPANLADPGGVRAMVAAPGPVLQFTELTATYGSGAASFSSPTILAQLQAVALGVAYVPAGSPSFPTSGLMVSGVLGHGDQRSKAWAYDVDARGTPRESGRRLFLTTVDDSSASQNLVLYALHFEPTTGDFLFLQSAGAGTARLYQVRGFVPPPPIK